MVRLPRDTLPGTARIQGNGFGKVAEPTGRAIRRRGQPECEFSQHRFRSDIFSGMSAQS